MQTGPFVPIPLPWTQFLPLPPAKTDFKTDISEQKSEEDGFFNLYNIISVSIDVLKQTYRSDLNVQKSKLEM